MSEPTSPLDPFTSLLTDALTAQGWHLVALPAGIASKAELLAGLAAAADFPDWAGSNWDAAEELLTDFSWLETPPAGLVLLWPDADKLAENAPEDAAIADDILQAVTASWDDLDVPFVVLRRQASRFESP